MSIKTRMRVLSMRFLFIFFSSLISFLDITPKANAQYLKGSEIEFSEPVVKGDCSSLPIKSEAKTGTFHVNFLEDWVISKLPKDGNGDISATCLIEVNVSADPSITFTLEGISIFGSYGVSVGHITSIDVGGVIYKDTLPSVKWNLAPKERRRTGSFLNHKFKFSSSSRDFPCGGTAKISLMFELRIDGESQSRIGSIIKLFSIRGDGTGGTIEIPFKTYHCEKSE